MRQEFLDTKSFTEENKMIMLYLYSVQNITIFIVQSTKWSDLGSVGPTPMIRLFLPSSLISLRGDTFGGVTSSHNPAPLSVACLPTKALSVLSLATLNSQLVDFRNIIFHRNFARIHVPFLQ